MNTQIDKTIYFDKTRWSNTDAMCILRKLKIQCTIWVALTLSLYAFKNKMYCEVTSCDVILVVGVPCTIKALGMRYFAFKIKLYHEVNQFDAYMSLVTPPFVFDMVHHTMQSWLHLC